MVGVVSSLTHTSNKVSEFGLHYKYIDGWKTLSSNSSDNQKQLSSNTVV